MGLMKKLTSAVVASSLVLGLVGTAFAAPSAEQNQAAFEILNAYKIVQGKLTAEGTSDPALGDTLTRAELVTVIVRAFGQEETAKLLKGAASFNDVAVDAWYSGYAALAKNIAEQKGITIGYEDGSFKPNQNVTMIEALAFVMKFLGVAPGTGANWVEDTVAAATDAGIITAADAEAYLADPSAPATRGNAFGLAYAIFSTFEMENGETVMTAYVDTEAPVLTVDAAAEPSTTATTATITGSVSGQVALFLENDEITVNEDGTFSVEVELNIGENTVNFYAVDLAGNVTPGSFTVARNPGVAEKVVAELSNATLSVDGTAELAVKVLDANDVEIETAAEDIEVTVAGEIGSYDAATGVFTAGTKATTGTITVTVGDLSAEAIDVTVNAGELEIIAVDNASIKVGGKATLTAQDKYGNAVTGVTYSKSSSDAFIDGNVFTGTAAGNYVVTGTKGDISKTVTIGVFGEAGALAVSAPTQVVANDTTQYAVTVSVVDENGNKVTTDDTTQVSLTAPGFTIFDKNGENAGTNDVTVTDGSYTFMVSSPVALQGQVIGFYAEDTSAVPALDDSSSVNVEVVRQVATALTLTADMSVVRVNEPAVVTYTATVVDQKDVAMKVGTFEVKTSLTGPATLVTNGELAYTFTTNAGTGKADIVVNNQQGVTGTINLTAVVDGIGTKTLAVKAAVAGAPSKVVLTAENVDGDAATSTTPGIGNKLTVTAEFQDANGIPVPYTGNVTITKSSTDSDIIIPGSAIVVTNASSTTFDVYTTGAYTGTFDVTATPSVDTVSAGKTALTINAGAYAKIGLSRSNTVVNVSVASPSASFSAQLYDAYGNEVSTSGVELTFKGYKAAFGTVVIGTTATSDEVTINGTAEEKVVTTDVNGVATVTVTTRPFSGQDYALSVEGLDASEVALTPVATNSDLVGILVSTSVAQTINVNLMTLSAGSLSNFYLDNAVAPKVLVKATLTDNYGVKLDGQSAGLSIVADEAILWQGGELVTAADYTAPTWYGNGDEAALTAAGVTNITDIAAGEYYAIVEVAKAGLVTLGVSHETGPATISGTKSVLVTAGAASKATVKEVSADDGKLYVTAGAVAGPFTVQLTDSYGNAVNSTTKVSLGVTMNLGGSVRTSAGGIAVSTIDTYGTATIYVTTPSAATYTIDFGSYGTVSVVAE